MQESDNSGLISNSKIDFLPYDLDYLTEELKLKAEKELFENEETRLNSLKELRAMLKEEEPNLRYMDEDHFLLMYLRAKKFNVKRTLTLLKNAFAIKEKNMDIVGNLSSLRYIKVLEDNSVMMLPYRDSEGCCILVFRLHTWNTDVNTHGDLIHLAYAALAHAVQIPATQVAGVRIIGDMAKLNVAKLRHLQLKYIWFIVEAYQDAFPARFKGIHFVNEGKLFKPVWDVMKQLIKSKHLSRVHFHGKDFRNLHKFFPPNILPKDFDGHLPPFDNSEFSKKLTSPNTLEYFSKLDTSGFIRQKNNTLQN